MITPSERAELVHLIDRPQLCAELDAAFWHRLTLVIAPAGAGKSTLLRQWSAAHPERAFACLDIEPADDQPSHFLRRLIAALAGAKPALAADAPPVGAGQDMADAAMVPASLGAAVEAATDVVIIIDDAQRFSNIRLVAWLGELVARAPHNLHVVVSSRSDPPIALSSLRLRDELLEIRQADLAFTEQESAQLLERITGHPMASHNVRALCARTEGWAAGLQLAGLNLRHTRATDAFIAEFGGSDRLVADYLGEEVLSILPCGQRQMLLQMSVLDDMCAGLVQAVTGCPSAQSVLEQLQRDSMFVIELDTRREWVRFHHLFRELLRSRLRAELNSAEQDLLVLAANWHLARGRTKSAVEYLLRAQLWDRALATILSHAVDVVAHGDLLTVVRWMLQIPESVRSERANMEVIPDILQRVGAVRGRSELLPVPAVGRQLAAMGEPSADVGDFAAQMLLATRPEISAAAAWHHLNQEGHAGGAVTTATRAPAPNWQLTSTFRQELAAGGRAFFIAGDMEQARNLLTRCLTKAAANSPEHVSSLSTLSLLEAWCGNAERAETLITKAVLEARDTGMLAHPAVADAYLASVVAALQRVDAGPLTGTGAPSLPAAPVEAAHESTMFFDRAMARFESGQIEQARAIVDAWAQLVPGPDPLAAVQRHVLLAWVAISENAPDRAKQELTESVRLAQIDGLIEVFAGAGPHFLGHLAAIAGQQAPFRDILVAHARQGRRARSQEGLPDPLTNRELEILSYLPTRFTNVEIADRCYISVNTVKTHMVHIYRKLDATNRDAAIDRARALGLL